MSRIQFDYDLSVTDADRIRFANSEEYRKKRNDGRVHYDILTRDSKSVCDNSCNHQECHRCSEATRCFGKPPDYRNEERHTAVKSNWLFSLPATWTNSEAEEPDRVVPYTIKPETYCQGMYKQLLERWFPNGQRFRAIQASCNALVTGFPIHCLMMGRDDPHAHELTLVVQNGHEHKLKDFLQLEGYRSNGERSEQDVITYSGHKTAIVKLIRLQEPPIRYILSSKYSVEMNFVTASKIYCLWASETIRDREAYLFHPFQGNTETDPSLENNLKSKGFAIKDQEIPREKMAKLTKLRAVHDPDTMIIPLDAIADQETTVPDDVIEVTSFQLRAGHVEHKGLCMRPLYVVRHRDLQYQYVVVEYFFARNKGLCDVFRKIMSEFQGRLVSYGCEPHSWGEFHLLPQLLVPDENGQLVAKTPEKKDKSFIGYLREIDAAYEGWEPELTESTSPGILSNPALLSSLVSFAVYLTWKGIVRSDR